jgi:hypothetical protein
MSESYLPAGIPVVYRGGKTLVFQSHEVKIDKQSRNLKTTHGISVDADPATLVKFGGTCRVIAIPFELTIIQRGKRPSHFEIVPKSPMPPSRYQALLDQIELEAMNDE